jgi:hypothetical protein
LLREVQEGSGDGKTKRGFIRKFSLIRKKCIEQYFLVAARNTEFSAGGQKVYCGKRKAVQ